MAKLFFMFFGIFFGKVLQDWLNSLKVMVDGLDKLYPEKQIIRAVRRIPGGM